MHASKQIGCVPLQKQKHVAERTAGYKPRTFSDTKRKLATTFRGCLVVLQDKLLLCPHVRRTLLALQSINDVLPLIMAENIPEWNM